MGKAARLRGGARRHKHKLIDTGAVVERRARLSELEAGVVDGAESTARWCPVCRRPSEGFAVERGKTVYHHFRRSSNCAVVTGSHIEGPGDDPGRGSLAEYPREGGSFVS